MPSHYTHFNCFYTLVVDTKVPFKTKVLVLPRCREYCLLMVQDSVPFHQLTLVEGTVSPKIMTPP